MLIAVFASGWNVWIPPIKCAVVTSPPVVYVSVKKFEEEMGLLVASRLRVIETAPGNMDCLGIEKASSRPVVEVPIVVQKSIPSVTDGGPQLNQGRPRPPPLVSE